MAVERHVLDTLIADPSLAMIMRGFVATPLLGCQEILTSEGLCQRVQDFRLPLQHLLIKAADDVFPKMI